MLLRDAAAGANRSAADHAAWPVPGGFVVFVGSTGLLAVTGSGCSADSRVWISSVDKGCIRDVPVSVGYAGGGGATCISSMGLSFAPARKLVPANRDMMVDSRSEEDEASKGVNEGSRPCLNETVRGCKLFDLCIKTCIHLCHKSSSSSQFPIPFVHTATMVRLITHNMLSCHVSTYLPLPIPPNRRSPPPRRKLHKRQLPARIPRRRR